METIRVPIAKAGKGAFIDVDQAVLESLSEADYRAVIAEGLKACLNAKMSSVGAITKMDGDELAEAKAKAMSIARKNLKDLTEGNFKFPGAAKAKADQPREVMNEAVRSAREVIRSALRAAGVPTAEWKAKDITEAAKLLVDRDPSYITKAKETLAKRVEAPAPTIDLEALGIHVDHEAIEAKKAATKAKRKETLSAAQAGRTKKAATTKSKPKASPADVIASMTSPAAGPRPAGHVHH